MNPNFVDAFPVQKVGVEASGGVGFFFFFFVGKIDILWR